MPREIPMSERDNERIGDVCYETRKIVAIHVTTDPLPEDDSVTEYEVIGQASEADYLSDILATLERIEALMVDVVNGIDKLNDNVGNLSHG